MSLLRSRKQTTTLIDTVRLSCHAVDAKIVGPAYKAVAEKYAGKPGAVQMLVNAALHGHVAPGAGCRGRPTPMSRRHRKQLVASILSLK